MAETTRDSLRELCEITLRAYVEVTETGAGTDMNGVLGVLSDTAKNLYYTTARKGAPGIPETDEALTRLTLEAYVLPYGYDLLEAMEAERVTRDFLFRLELAETIAERVLAAGFRPTIQVFGAG